MSMSVMASAFSVQGPKDTCGKRGEGLGGEFGKGLGVARTNCHNGTEQAGTCLQRTTIGSRLRKVDYDCLLKYPPALLSRWHAHHDSRGHVSYLSRDVPRQLGLENLDKAEWKLDERSRRSRGSYKERGRCSS